MMPAVSSTDSVVWVTKPRVAGSAGAKRAASASVSIKVTAPSGNWPIVPITSGWPAWPIRSTWRPSLWWRIACLCTFDTNGQVASR